MVEGERAENFTSLRRRREGGVLPPLPPAEGGAPFASGRRRRWRGSGSVPTATAALRPIALAKVGVKGEQGGCGSGRFFGAPIRPTEVEGLSNAEEVGSGKGGQLPDRLPPRRRGSIPGEALTSEVQLWRSWASPERATQPAEGRPANPPGLRVQRPNKLLLHEHLMSCG